MWRLAKTKMMAGCNDCSQVISGRPQGVRRLQTPHLYHIKSNRRIDLGHFHSPPEYKGEWRVDTQPRTSRDERFVCINSPHGGRGRQLYLIDIRGVS